MNFEDIFPGFSQPPQDTFKKELRDRIKTTIIRAKRGCKQSFIEELARDYIRLSKEL
jgi:hypothetical protein